jgi:hypothetical protein
VHERRGFALLGLWRSPSETTNQAIFRLQFGQQCHARKSTVEVLLLDGPVFLAQRTFLISEGAVKPGFAMQQDEKYNF